MITIDDDDLRRAMNHLARAFDASKANQRIKRQVSARLRKILRPMVEERKARVLALPSKGHAGTSMRQAIAKQIRAGTRWKGKNTGISVIQRARGMPRDFAMAGRAFNREEGWSPQTLGGESTHQEIRPVRWFDDAATGDAPVARREIIEALDAVAGMMADDIRRIR